MTIYSVQFLPKGDTKSTQIQQTLITADDLEGAVATFYENQPASTEIVNIGDTSFHPASAQTVPMDDFLKNPGEVAVKAMHGELDKHAAASLAGRALRNPTSISHDEIKMLAGSVLAKSDD